MSAQPIWASRAGRLLWEKGSALPPLVRKKDICRGYPRHDAMAAIVVGIMSGFSSFFLLKLKPFNFSQLEGRFRAPPFLAPHRTTARMARAPRNHIRVFMTTEEFDKRLGKTKDLTGASPLISILGKWPIFALTHERLFGPFSRNGRYSRLLKVSAPRESARPERKRDPCGRAFPHRLGPFPSRRAGNKLFRDSLRCHCWLRWDISDAVPSR
jgi:hypothetical protein